MCLLKDTATTEFYTYGHTLSLHAALPCCPLADRQALDGPVAGFPGLRGCIGGPCQGQQQEHPLAAHSDCTTALASLVAASLRCGTVSRRDRKSTRLNSSH